VATLTGHPHVGKAEVRGTHFPGVEGPAAGVGAAGARLARSAVAGWPWIDAARRRADEASAAGAAAAVAGSAVYRTSGAWALVPRAAASYLRSGECARDVSGRVARIAAGWPAATAGSGMAAACPGCRPGRQHRGGPGEHCGSPGLRIHG
jgi:hypothetical protein